MHPRKCYVCKKCGGHHWYFLNAIECCQDFSEEKIKERRDIETANYLCVHCNKRINPTLYRGSNNLKSTENLI